MDRATAKLKLDELHTKLLEDILYTEVLDDGRGFVDKNLYMIGQESGGQWDDEVASRWIEHLKETALIPPKATAD